ncbi:DsbA family oxidoreductase [Ralstonia solanacearum]|uniref:DsbA family oxidoreductase n=1 Tax=Ralstonia solanacearum TaxID=305 RepID=A0AAE3NEV0_RALSL|nr:DsbA family oxidoreductase [Ralstonia solanacearum]MBB6584835.1 DsbA family oxidoreductase [Ralstonia solanacearum]MDB0520815.1 DsbA family oxidoreductase [Ralstonia solanacearum]
MNLIVTITSDFICPWCLVGERRLAKALATLPKGITVETHWCPFELNPDLPAQGVDRKTYRTMKFGSWARSQTMDAHTVQAGKDDGIAFDYAAIERTPNTFQAHRLMQLAERQGVATAVAAAVFSAYFEQGRDIGDAAVLADIAVESGLAREAVDAFLAGDEGVQEVRTAERAVQASGVRSVPLFEIGGEVISGAQSVEQFALALQRATGLAEGCVDGACSVG